MNVHAGSNHDDDNNTDDNDNFQHKKRLAETNGSVGDVVDDNMIIMLPNDILRWIASFVDATTLAALDAVSKEQRHVVTVDAWASLAMQRFGFREGNKDAYKTGIALWKPSESEQLPFTFVSSPISADVDGTTIAMQQPDDGIDCEKEENDEDDHDEDHHQWEERNNLPILLHNPLEYDGAFAGSTVVAQNESTLVMGADYHHHYSSFPSNDDDDDDIHDENNFLPEFPLQIRNGTTLEIVRHFDCGVRVWNVVICGGVDSAVGQDIIVVSTMRDVIAFYNPTETISNCTSDESNNLSQEQSIILHRGSHDETGLEETQILGNPKVLIVLRCGYLYIHRPTITKALHVVGKNNSCATKGAPSEGVLQFELICQMRIVEPRIDFECSVIAWSSLSSAATATNKKGTKQQQHEFGFCIKRNCVSVWTLYDALVDNDKDDQPSCKIQPHQISEFQYPNQDQHVQHQEDLYNALAFNEIYVAVSKEGSTTVTVFCRAQGIWLYDVSDTIGQPGRFFAPNNNINNRMNADIYNYVHDNNNNNNNNNHNIIEFNENDNTIQNDIMTDLIPSMDLQMVGLYYLISSSVKGCVLGIWDLRSGKPSYRSIENQYFFDATFGWDYPPKMVRLLGWKYAAFCVTTPNGQLMLWGFPQSREDQIHYNKIRFREKQSVDSLTASRLARQEGRGPYGP